MWTSKKARPGRETGTSQKPGSDTNHNANGRPARRQAGISPEEQLDLILDINMDRSLTYGQRCVLSHIVVRMGHSTGYAVCSYRYIQEATGCFRDVIAAAYASGWVEQLGGGRVRVRRPFGRGNH